MGSLFSSPGKTATQAAQGTAAAEQGIIGSTGPVTVPAGPGNPGGTTVQPLGSGLEGYTATGEQAQRDAIAGMGPNPYFAAAQGMSPSAYAVDPNYTASFSAQPGQGFGPGQTNAFGPPGSPSGGGQVNGAGTGVTTTRSTLPGGPGGLQNQQPYIPPSNAFAQPQQQTVLPVAQRAAQ